MFDHKPQLIHHFLEYSAARLPDKIALVHEETRASYQQINSQANCLAHFFLNQGLQRGDRVAFLLDNSLEYVVTYYAILKAGGVAAPLNTEQKSAGLGQILHELDPKFLITVTKFEKILLSCDLPTPALTALIVKRPKVNFGKHLPLYSWTDIVADTPGKDPDQEIASNALASIIYTSGSTSRPKGVMLSHGNIVANVSSICQYLRLDQDDIQMVVLPFFYVMGKSLLNTHFAVGGRLVINNKFAYPASVINQMVVEQVTGFSGVPSTYSFLVHNSPLADSREKLQFLRYCSQAGGHMASSLKRQLMGILPETTELVVMYGATEASARLAFVEPVMLEKKIDSIGRAIPGVTLRVLATNGKEVLPGTVGELVASGPNIMQGYWQDATATQQALSSKGYHTGDLAYQDEDGYYYVVGRRDDQLKVGGHRINPQFIEDVIVATNLVAEAAVVGLPDPLLGYSLVALVVVVAGSDEVTPRLMKECAAKLAHYQMPQQLIVVDQLPKNASGKVDRKRCAEIGQARKL